jgi:hypothetical protein
MTLSWHGRKGRLRCFIKFCVSYLYTGGRACLGRGALLARRWQRRQVRAGGEARRKRARHCLGAWRVRGIAFFGFSSFLDSRVFPCFCTHRSSIYKYFLGEEITSPPTPGPSPRAGRRVTNRPSRSLDSISVVLVPYRTVQRQGAIPPPLPSLTSIIGYGKPCQDVARLSRPPAAMKQSGTHTLLFLMALVDVTQGKQGCPCRDDSVGWSGRAEAVLVATIYRHIGVRGASEARAGSPGPKVTTF